MPDQFEHPFRRSAAVTLANHHSDLAEEDRALLYAEMERHPELGAMFAQSVIAENFDLIALPEVRRFVIDEIPNVKDSIKQAELLEKLTKENLTREQASFVVGNILNYFEEHVTNHREGERFTRGGDLDLRFFALQRTSKFHTANDKLRLSRLAQTDPELEDFVNLMNGRTPSENQHRDERPAHQSSASPSFTIYEDPVSSLSSPPPTLPVNHRRQHSPASSVGSLSSSYGNDENVDPGDDRYATFPNASPASPVSTIYPDPEPYLPSSPPPFPAGYRLQHSPASSVSSPSSSRNTDPRNDRGRSRERDGGR